MNNIMILNENKKIDEDLQSIIKELDKYLEQAKELDKILEECSDLQNCEENLKNKFKVNEIYQYINYNRKRIQELCEYINSINYENKIKHAVIGEKMQFIYNMIMNMPCFESQVNIYDELLNRFMIKIKGQNNWGVIKLSSNSMQSFQYLENNEKIIFEFIWNLQKVECLKEICINIVSLIKLINCNYLEIDDKEN